MGKKARAVMPDFSWFDLKNYDFINDLTVIELIKEIEWRSPLFCFNGHYIDIENGDAENSIHFKRIFKGDPNLLGKSKNDVEFNELVEQMTLIGEALKHIKNKMPSARGVSPLNFIELAELDYDAREKGIYSPNGDDKLLFTKRRYAYTSISNHINSDTGRIHLYLYLKDNTDAELLANIKLLLPLWREKLGIPEPEISNDRMGVGAIQKLVSYRVIPLLDILIWGVVHNKEIPNPVLGALIFPDDPKDTQVIKETIKPTALKSISENFIRLSYLYLKEDSEIGSARVSDLMRR